nr:craniofacial development protein 2-like [Penaeus vannamei]
MRDSSGSPRRMILPIWSSLLETTPGGGLCDQGIISAASDCNETSRSNGVGFLVNKTCSPLIEDYQPISDRLALLNLKGKFSRLVFIQCYFPTLSHPDEEILELYDNIQSIVNDIPKRDHLFFMGDFNCKLGRLQNTFPSAIGKHTPSIANTRGELLAQFCVKNNLVVTNTMFQKKKSFYLDLTRWQD